MRPPKKSAKEAEASGAAPMDVDDSAAAVPTSAVEAADEKLSVLLESGRDKNSAIYKAIVKIQANFRYVCGSMEPPQGSTLGSRTWSSG